MVFLFQIKIDSNENYKSSILFHQRDNNLIAYKNIH